MQEDGFAAGVVAGQNNGNAGYANGMWGMEWMWVILLFAMWGGGGWGNNWGGGNMNGSLTRSDLCQDMNFNNLENAVRGIQQGLCDGFYAQNTTMLQGFNAVQSEIANCCCQTQRAIDGVNYNMAKNTCDIINSMNAGFQRLADQNTQRYISQLEKENLQYSNQLSQNAQTQAIINGILPPARPAYITCSPFQSSYGTQAQAQNNGCQYC